MKKNRQKTYHANDRGIFDEHGASPFSGVANHLYMSDDCVCNCHILKVENQHCRVTKCIHCEQPKQEFICEVVQKSGKLTVTKTNSNCLVHREQPESQDKSGHKIGEHGAVGFVTQEGRVCVECREPIEDKEVPTSMSGAKEEGIEQRFEKEFGRSGYWSYEDGDSEPIFRFIRQEIKRVQQDARRSVAEEILEKIPYWAVGLFPVNRIEIGDKYTSAEIIETWSAFVKYRLRAKYLSKEGGI